MVSLRAASELDAAALGRRQLSSSATSTHNCVLLQIYYVWVSCGRKLQSLTLHSTAF